MTQASGGLSQASSPRSMTWVASVAGILVFALLGLTTYATLQSLSNAVEWLKHTERVRLVLSETLSSLKDAQSSTRGYLITHEDWFLVRHGRAVSTIEQYLTELQALSSHDVKQKASVSEFSGLSREIIGYQRETIGLAREQALAPGLVATRVRQDRERMTAARVLHRDLQLEEIRTRDLRSARADLARLRAAVATFVTTICGIGIVLMLRAVHRRGESRLRQSEQWLSTTLRSIGDAVIATDAKGEIAFMNDVACALTGWDAPSARGRLLREVFQIVEEGTGRSREDPVARVLQAGKIVELAPHTLLVRRDGTQVPIEDSVAPIFDDSRQIIGVVLVFKDASAARAAQSALRASEARYRVLFEQSPLGVAVVDRSADAFVELNRAFAGSLGYSRDEMWGRAPSAVLGLRDLRTRLPEQPSDQPVTLQMSLRHRSGSAREMLASARLDEINPRLVHFILVDVTEREQAQATLARTEERLRLAVAGAELGTWDLDLASDKPVWNLQMYTIVGLDPTIPLTREVPRSFILPEDSSLIKQAMRTARDSGQPFSMEHRITRASDRAVRWVSVKGRYLYDEYGKATRVMGVVADVTERRLLDQRMRQSQKLDALGTLAGGIAHDFNNILAVLRGNLQLAQSEVPSGSSLESILSDMNSACARAGELVRQILTFSRQQEQDRRVIPIKPVLEEALKLLRSTLPTTIGMRIEIADDLPLVLADATQVHQVMMNLGINAAHAIGSRPGSIHVTADRYQVEHADAAAELRPGTYIRVGVSDTGAGMSREVQERIFEPFFTTKPLGQGTGLGLSVVRGIMRNHDGGITVYSEPGQGTRFNLYFPATADTAAEVTAPVIAARAGQGERILYIDDEKALVSLVTRLLQKLGYRVQGFSDWKEALAAFNAAPDDFDLVLTDMSMPGTTGVDVAQEILARRPDIPVLLASGYVRPEEVERALAAGIRKVLWKPASLTEMGEILSEEFGRSLSS